MSDHDDNKGSTPVFAQAAGMPFDAERVGRNFNRVFGDAMRSFNVISEEQYDQAGNVQAWTIVIAKLARLHGEAVADRAREKYGHVNKIPFQDLTPDEIETDLKNFVSNLANDYGEDPQNLFEAAKSEIQNAINNEGSVDSEAAPIAVVHKGLFLSGKERAIVPNAFFMMQFGLRALSVLRQWQLEPIDSVHKAQSVLYQHNKLNPGIKKELEEGRKYFPDDDWVLRGHYALRSICNDIIGMNGRNPMPHEKMGMEYHQNIIIASMEKAAQMFDEIEKPVLANMARQLREHLAIEYLKFDETKFANATPEAVEAIEEQYGSKEQGNSPHRWLATLTA